MLMKILLMLFVTNMAIAKELPYLVANKVNGTLESEG